MQAPQLGYLEPLFTLAKSMHGPDDVGVSFGLDTPPAESALVADDEWTGGYHLSTLLISRVTTALDHVLTLDTVVSRGVEITPIAPWTLLRSALETSVVALWASLPRERQERGLRALRIWHEVVSERLKWEGDSNWVESGGRSLEYHRAAILAIASRHGLQRGTIASRPSTIDCLVACATHLGTSPAEATARWRESSGMSHGYDWATLNFSDVQPREQSVGGFAGTMRFNEAKHAQLAELVHSTLSHALLRYSDLCKSETPRKSGD